MQFNTLRNAAALLLLGGALTATPALGRRKIEQGVESAHQPRVERTDFIFDVKASSDGALGTGERVRLTAWLDALGLRYGDHVTLGGSAEAGSGRYSLAGVRLAVGEVVARYGLLTEGEAPITAGEAPLGSLRVVVSRSVATVPGCPAWRDKMEADLNGGLADNYGCANASNLAAMVADPRDLVEGRHTETDLRNATGTRAIRTYQEKTPTGAGSLQITKTGGQ